MNKTLNTRLNTSIEPRYKVLPYIKSVAVMCLLASIAMGNAWAAVDNAAIAEIENKASSAISKADGNNSRIQALEAEDVILHQKADNNNSSIQSLVAKDVILHQEIANTKLPDGVDPGDMLYWNGTDWLLTPAPPANAASTSPTLTLIAGVPTWTSTATEVVYAIGDTGPAGGIVFYVTDGGLHGLEASPKEYWANVSWGCDGKDLAGADGTAVGTGAFNTASILAQCGGVGTAADFAGAYMVNGYDDWFLPSKDELNLLYLHRDVTGSFSDDHFYWSSSESSSDYAWAQILASSFPPPNSAGFQNDISKYGEGRVRAIRAF